MQDIVLTPDQEILIEHLEQFKNDNRCYFGVYGPAGSGKSFTISYFIAKHNLYEKVLLSGTTNNACRVLEQSLETHSGRITVYKFFELLNTLISEMTMHLNLIEDGYYNIQNQQVFSDYIKKVITFSDTLKEIAQNILDAIDEDYYLHDDIKIKTKKCKKEGVRDDTNNANNDKDGEDEEYVDVLHDAKVKMKEQDKTLAYLDAKTIQIMKNKIQTFIKENCDEILLSKLYIKRINNNLETLFSKNKYIRTIHSLLAFEQCRDENHNIVFLPSKSNIKETKTKKTVKYEFTPKLSGKRKSKYDSLDDEQRKEFDKEFYNVCFEKLSETQLLIIDESSMMKELEYRYVIYICKILKLKVIFLGDKYQLPPVDDNDINKLAGESQSDVLIDYSPAVKLKDSYTLSTIKRTSNPVLQEVYKTYRDLVEQTGQGKIKLSSIRNIKNINVTDKYLIQTRGEIQTSIDYVKKHDEQLSNTRILCFSNKEVNMMNTMIRQHLYGLQCDKYITNEILLVLNYMALPSFSIKQLILLESMFENNNKLLLNYVFNKITENVSQNSLLKNNEEYENVVEAFRDINNKENKLKLYTSSTIKIIKIVNTQVYMKDKTLNVSFVFFSFEDQISIFFIFNNFKDNAHVRDVLKTDKQLIKMKTDLFKMHSCSERCDKTQKKHVCDECNNIDTCPHMLFTCNNESCTLVCNSCYSCNSECTLCIKQHRNKYSTSLWDNYVNKEYLLEPSINYSYATTVHKAQGQSIDNIIVCEYNIANCILYNREVSEYQKYLIYPTCMYTAVTRAKNILIRLK